MFHDLVGVLCAPLDVYNSKCLPVVYDTSTACSENLAVTYSMLQYSQMRVAYHFCSPALHRTCAILEVLVLLFFCVLYHTSVQQVVLNSMLKVGQVLGKL